MPESPLSPTAAARQSPASSLLTHTDNSAGERGANGDSCSGVSAETWQSLQRKQVYLHPPPRTLPHPPLLPSSPPPLHTW